MHSSEGIEPSSMWAHVRSSDSTQNHRIWRHPETSCLNSATRHCMQIHKLDKLQALYFSNLGDTTSPLSRKLTKSASETALTFLSRKAEGFNEGASSDRSLHAASSFTQSWTSLGATWESSSHLQVLAWRLRTMSSHIALALLKPLTA